MGGVNELFFLRALGLSFKRFDFTVYFFLLMVPFQSINLHWSEQSAFGQISLCSILFISKIFCMLPNLFWIICSLVMFYPFPCITSGREPFNFIGSIAVSRIENALLKRRTTVSCKIVPQIWGRWSCQNDLGSVKISWTISQTCSSINDLMKKHDWRNGFHSWCPPQRKIWDTKD